MCQLWALHVVTKRQFFYILVKPRPRAALIDYSKQNVDTQGVHSRPTRLASSETWRVSVTKQSKDGQALQLRMKRWAPFWRHREDVVQYDKKLAQVEM